MLHIIDSCSRRYPLALSSSLKIANDLINIQKYDSDYASIAEEIELNILKGKVCITEYGDVEFEPFNIGESIRISFDLSSSLVKNLASLVIYLRHIIKEGDTLIIDGAELSLSPEVQVLLTQIMAKLSNRGLKIVIVTHSDYIIREINNLIIVNQLIGNGSESDLSGTGYEKEYGLNKSKVEALYFNFEDKSNRVSVSQLRIDDDGFDVESIDTIINRQNIISEWLYDRLIEGREP